MPTRCDYNLETRCKKEPLQYRTLQSKRLPNPNFNYKPPKQKETNIDERDERVDDFESKRLADEIVFILTVRSVVLIIVQLHLGKK